MKPRTARLGLVALGLAVLALAAVLILNAFRSNLVFFVAPSELLASSTTAGRNVRIGGMVEPGSVERGGADLLVRFRVTDTARSVPVVYHGILPDLFREGKGVVAQGKLGTDGVFVASEVLAKHDENYMPPQAGDAIERARVVRHEMSEARR